jgi:hypothetical protein
MRILHFIIILIIFCIILITITICVNSEKIKYSEDVSWRNGTLEVIEKESPIRSWSGDYYPLYFTINGKTSLKSDNEFLWAYFNVGDKANILYKIGKSRDYNDYDYIILQINNMIYKITVTYKFSDQINKE